MAEEKPAEAVATPPSSSDSRADGIRRRAVAVGVARLVPVGGLAVLVAVTVLGLVLTFAGFGARQSWVADLVTNFRMQLGLGLGVCGLLLGLARWNGLATLALVGGAFHMVFVLPAWMPFSDHSPPNARPFTVLLANVGSDNLDHAAVISAVQQELPEVAVLLETNQQWIDGLASLREAYRHGVTVPRADSFGAAVFSRVPISSTVTESLGDRGLPTVIAELDMGRGAVTLIAAHAPPPVNASAARERDAYLRQLTTVARSHRTPMILCGDLNTTQWSPVFGDLVQGTGLRDASRGFGLHPTWNASHPRLLQLPLDHCLASADIGVRGVRRGPKLGSDHLPIIVDLAVAIR